MIKKKILWFILTGIAVLSIICLTVKNIHSTNDVRWPEDGLYFLKNNSYLGYYSDEEPCIQLPFIFVHAENKNKTLPQYVNYTLRSEDGNVNLLASANIIESSEEDDSTLYTCILNLNDKQDPGIYKLNYLQAEDKNGKEQKAYIGSWTIEIKKGECPTDIKVGAKMIYSGVFDRYRVELENNTTDELNVKGITFNLPENQCQTSAITASDFNLNKDISKGMTLKPHQKRTFNYSFIKPSGFPKYIFMSLKPFLKYRKKGNEYTLSLPDVNYSTSFINNEEIIEQLKSITPVQ